jgi:hypothetical protein
MIGPLMCHRYRVFARLPISDPVIEELQGHPIPDGYLEYLHLKLCGIPDNASPAKTQKATFSEDR